METNQELRAEIERQMAATLYEDAHMSWCEEYGDGSNEPDMDEIDPGALKAARELRDALENAHGKPLDILFHEACAIAMSEGFDTHCTPEYFGHYTAMTHMGHGVGLGDYFGDRAEKFMDVPWGEFGYYYLENDEKYPIPFDPPSPEQQARHAEILAMLEADRPKDPGPLFAPRKDG